MIEFESKRANWGESDGLSATDCDGASSAYRARDAMLEHALNRKIELQSRRVIQIHPAGSTTVGLQIALVALAGHTTLRLIDSCGVDMKTITTVAL